jgi:hypothetical protein
MHLFMSVPSEKYPHRAAAPMIDEAFGFTDWDGRRFDRLTADKVARVVERSRRRAAPRD